MAGNLLNINIMNHVLLDFTKTTGSQEGLDMKRRAHFSSLIMTNQMERSEAIKRLEQPEMDEFFPEKRV